MDSITYTLVSMYIPSLFHKCEAGTLEMAIVGSNLRINRYSCVRERQHLQEDPLLAIVSGITEKQGYGNLYLCSVAVGGHSIGPHVDFRNLLASLAHLFHGKCLLSLMGKWCSPVIMDGLRN